MECFPDSAIQLDYILPYIGSVVQGDEFSKYLATFVNGNILVAVQCSLQTDRTVRDSCWDHYLVEICMDQTGARAQGLPALTYLTLRLTDDRRRTMANFSHVDPHVQRALMTVLRMRGWMRPPVPPMRRTRVAWIRPNLCIPSSVITTIRSVHLPASVPVMCTVVLSVAMP